MNIKVYCGTKDPSSIWLSIESYAAKLHRQITTEDKDHAVDMLRREMSTPKFAASGYRNNQAVNCCIALHVLGYNPISWFEEYFKEFGSTFEASDISAFMEHLERVVPYLNHWGPLGSEAYAFAYSIGY